MWKFLLWASTLCAQSPLLNDWMILGMKDGYLEDQTKLRLIQAAHQASLAFSDSRRVLYEMNLRSANVGANSAEDLKRSEMEWLREVKRSQRLAHEVEYQAIGMEIGLAILESTRTGNSDSMAIEQLYWKRWERRCQALEAGVAEHQSLLDYWEWLVATDRSLVTSGAVAEESIIRDEMEREDARQKLAAFQDLHRNCRERPFDKAATALVQK